MVIYKCDKCGEIKDSLGEMTNIKISHAGKSEVNFPRNGEYQICKGCTNELLHEWVYKWDEKPVNCAHWIKTILRFADEETAIERWKCSYCGTILFKKVDICPTCNATMESDNE